MMIAWDGLRVVPVSETDLSCLLGVYHQCEDFLARGPEPRASAEMVLRDLAASRAEDGLFCGIFDGDGRMLGVLDFTPGGRRGNPAEAHIELLMLASPHRRGGLGTAIVRAVEAEIWSDTEVEAIATEVQVNNPDALRFWKRLGYRIVAGPTLQPDGTTVFHLRKCREAGRT